MAVSEWTEYFDHEASLRDNIGQLYQHLPMFIEIMESAPKAVLEVGIGTGVMSATLAAIAGLRATGVDIEESLLEAASRRWENVGGLEFAAADAFQLDRVFEPDTFDVAFSQGFFEHFTDEQIRELAVKQLRVARRVVFSVPSDQYGRRDLGDERLMSDVQWLNILDGVGRVTTTYYGANRRYLIKPWGPFGGLGRMRYWHVLSVIDRE